MNVWGGLKIAGPCKLKASKRKKEPLPIWLSYFSSSQGVLKISSGSDDKGCEQPLQPSTYAQ